MTIPAHRAESNLVLRYHLTIKGGKHCVLYTSNGGHLHKPGKDFLFDHSRFHRLVKRSLEKRVVLILDIHRF
jgi:aspartyl/asparaginyl beta-hydroxylase (cupin superfamily)